MKVKKRITIITASLLALALLTVAGCNTIEGMGEDLEDAGQAIESEAG